MSPRPGIEGDPWDAGSGDLGGHDLICASDAWLVLAACGEAWKPFWSRAEPIEAQKVLTNSFLNENRL